MNKIVAIQGDHPSKLNPKSDTSIFLAIEAQNRKCKIFYYEPKDLSIINDKVLAKGYYIKFSYSSNNFFKIMSKQTLDLSKKGLESRDVLNKSGENETKFLNHLEKLINNKTTNADHMINKFSKDENLTELYDK